MWAGVLSNLRMVIEKVHVLLCSFVPFIFVLLELFFQFALLLGFIPSNSLIQARRGAIFCLPLHTLLWPVQSSRGGSR